VKRPRKLFEWDYSDYPGAKTYPHPFKPIQIGNLMVPNRIKYAAVAGFQLMDCGRVGAVEVDYCHGSFEKVTF
jgi:hypothetical protein